MPRTSTIQPAIYAGHVDRLARPEANRLTEDDRQAIRAGIAAALVERRHIGITGQPCSCASIADDFYPVQRAAWRSIGCGPFDLRESETFEIADMVAAAIIDAGAGR